MDALEARVGKYWERHASAFESVYTGHKSGFGRFLDRKLRKDMFVRYGMTFEECGPLEGKRVLDIGCGPGHYCAEFARRGVGRVVGIDVAEGMLQLARQTAQERNFTDRCEFIHTTLDDFRPDQPFDVAVAMGFFDYVKNPLPSLKHIRSMTRDRVLATFPDRTWRAPLRKLRLGLLGCPVYFFSRDELTDLFRDAGYSRMDILYSGQIHFVRAHP